MAKPAKPLEVLCPDCGCVLFVDPGTGAVLEHKSKPKPKTFGSFEDAFGALRKSDEAREDRFRASVESEKQRGERMKQQFEHLLGKVKEEDDGKKPPSPFDAD